MELLADKPLLLSNESELLPDISQLQPHLPQLQPNLASVRQRRGEGGEEVRQEEQEEVKSCRVEPPGFMYRLLWLRSLYYSVNITLRSRHVCQLTGYIITSEWIFLYIPLT